MYSIDSSKYIKVKKVQIDGKDWDIRAVGAGEELALAQIQRRLKFIEQQIESGKAIAEDIEKAEELENKMLSIFKSLFKDSTSDNSEVNAWIEDTPLSMINQVLEEIKLQSEANDEATGDKARGQGESSPVSTEPSS